MGNVSEQPQKNKNKQNKCMRRDSSVCLTYNGLSYVIAKEGSDAHSVTFTKHCLSQQQQQAVAPMPTNASLIQQREELYFDAIYGVTTLSQKTYMILVTSSHQVGQIKNKPIYRVDQVQFVQIGNQQTEDMFQKYLKQSFSLCALYFSSYNLTQRLQFSYQNPPYYQHSYFSNYLYTLQYQHYPLDLLTKFILGFVETKSTQLQGTTYQQTIISRGNFNNIGRRWLRRGLNSSAHAANSFQIEYVIEISRQNTQHVYSYLQVRGSIPLLWSQAPSFKLKPTTVLHKDYSLNASLFKEYMLRQQNLQRIAHIINLLGTQNLENRLGKLYELHYNQLKPQSTRFTSWDYQNQYKLKGKAAFQDLMHNLQQQIQKYSYFKVVIQKDRINYDVESYQQGTFRTNCLDSLDRTNYVQMLFAKLFALNALNNYQQHAQIAIDPYVSLPVPQLQSDFKQLWIKSGNQISYQNSGTELMKLDFYQDGKRTIRGAFRDFGVGFRRHLLGHFMDYYLQNCMDLHFKKLSLQQEEQNLEGQFSQKTTRIFICGHSIFTAVSYLQLRGIAFQIAYKKVCAQRIGFYQRNSYLLLIAETVWSFTAQQTYPQCVVSVIIFKASALFDQLVYSIIQSMMILGKSCWILSLLLCCCLSFLVDHNNAFYLNTSYARQTISFSMNFRAIQPTQIKLISKILIPQNNHIMIGSLQPSKTIHFDNPFNSDLILYNSYEDGEHWFGVKIKYQNPHRYDFARLELHFKQQTNVTAYVFLVPLFTLPLNAIQVSPINTLYACHQSALVSYLYSYSEIDFYAIGRKDVAKGFKVVQKKDWGFYRQDLTANYLRHKSKSKVSSLLSLSYSKADGTNYQCKIGEATSNQIFQNEAEGYTLEQLLKTSEQLNSESAKPHSQL